MNEGAGQVERTRVDGGWVVRRMRAAPGEQGCWIELSFIPDLDEAA